MPIGLLAVPAYALLRAGGWLARSARITDLRAAVTGGVTLGAAYGFAVAVVASAATSHSVRPSAGQALLAGCCVGVLFGTAGIVRGAGLAGACWAAVPVRGRAMLRAAGGGVAVMLGAGALLVVGSLVVHAGRVVSLGGSLGPGPVGAAALVLASLAYLPTAVLWGTAYAVGPGVCRRCAHVGVTARRAPWCCPCLPLLGALPGSGPAPRCRCRSSSRRSQPGRWPESW